MAHGLFIALGQPRAAVAMALDPNLMVEVTGIPQLNAVAADAFARYAAAVEVIAG